MDSSMNDNGVDDFDAFLNLDDQFGANINLPLFDHNAPGNALDYDHMQQHQQQQQHRQAAQQHQHQQDGFQGMQQHVFDPSAHQHMQGHNAQQMGGYAQMAYGQMNPDAMTSAPYHPGLQKTISGHSYHQAINGAPPTPHSGEMHAKNAAYQQARAQQQQFTHRSGDQNAFTPFLSPELDGSASVMSHAQGYTTPGMYNLSPLTSPAIGPQHGNDGRAPRSHPLTASGSLVGSPVDTMGQEEDDDDNGERPRKTRKKTPAARKIATTNATRQRKTPTSTPRMRGGLNLQIPDHTGSSNGSADSPFLGEAADAFRHNGSASSSISPRPLADAIMAPPPKPHTPTAATQGPVEAMMQQHNPHAQHGSRQIHPAQQHMQHNQQKQMQQQQQQQQMQQSPHPHQTQQPLPFQQNGRPTASPATPTSMMKLKSPGPGSAPGTGSTSLAGQEMQSPALESSMEFLKLPEAATGPPRQDEVPSAQAKTAALPKLKTKTSTGDSATNSPHTSALASPAGPQGKADGKGGRMAKKRNSSSSNLVSPALRPKVSPGIKPLLPEGTPIDSQTHALLLASRSNYENILSGSHLPGVSYPADLSANLTSKRTSHKIAEQGRRNRINLALNEMQTLLPSDFKTIGSPSSQTADSDGKGKNGSKTPSTPAANAAAQGGSSKAATVECAIEYIKHLQQDSTDKDAAIEQMKQEIRMLRLKTGGSSSSD